MLLGDAMPLCLQSILPRIPLPNPVWLPLIHPLRLSSGITYSVKLSLITTVYYSGFSRETEALGYEHRGKEIILRNWFM